MNVRLSERTSESITKSSEGKKSLFQKISIIEKKNSEFTTKLEI